MKPFSKLTDNQKSKVQSRIDEACKRTIDTVTFLGYLDNSDKKQTILQDSIDIYFKSVSDIIHRGDFESKLLSKLSENTNFKEMRKDGGFMISSSRNATIKNEELESYSYEQLCKRAGIDFKDAIANCFSKYDLANLIRKGLATGGKFEELDKKYQALGGRSYLQTGGSGFIEWREKLIKLIESEAKLTRSEIALTEADILKFYEAGKSPEDVYFKEWMEDAGYYYKIPFATGGNLIELTPEEDIEYDKLMAHFLNNGFKESKAEAETIVSLRKEFPRLKKLMVGDFKIKLAIGGELSVFAFTHNGEKYFTLGKDDGEKPHYSQHEIDLMKQGYVLEGEYNASRKSREQVEPYLEEIKREYPVCELVFSHSPEYFGFWRVWVLKSGSLATAAGFVQLANGGPLLDQIKKDLESFRPQGSHGYIYDYGNGFASNFRHLGNWIDNDEDASEFEDPDSDRYDPGWREDNDQHIWAPGEYRRFKEMFIAWAKNHSWFNEVNLSLQTSEKDNCEFIIELKPEAEKPKSEIPLFDFKKGDLVVSKRTGKDSDAKDIEVLTEQRDILSASLKYLTGADAKAVESNLIIINSALSAIKPQIRVMWEGKERLVKSKLTIGNKEKYEIELDGGKTIWTDKATIDHHKEKHHKGGEILKHKPWRFQPCDFAGLGKCICVKGIHFTHGLSYFKNLKYGYDISNLAPIVAVAYEDGRFTNMSKEVFEEHFKKVD